MEVAQRIPGSEAPKRRLSARRPQRHAPALRLDHFAAADRGANNFDLLRLTAAVVVVFAHSFDLVLTPEPLMSTIGVSWGEVGVLIFFSISGFLVTRSWVGEPKLLPFALKRALRLMPGLVVVLLLSALVLGPLVTAEPIHAYVSAPATRSYVLNNALLQTIWNLPGVFVHNIYPQAVNGSLWTLPLEVKAYAFVAVAGVLGLLTGRRRWLLLALPAYAVLVTIPRVVTRVPGGTHFTLALANIQMPSNLLTQAGTGAFQPYTELFLAFTIGTALYVLRSHVSLRWRYAALAALAFAAATRIGGRAPAITLAVVGPYIVLCLAYRTTSFVRLPQRLGDLSYGMYLYAFPVQQLVSQLITPGSGWILFIVALPVTSVLAAGSWHLVERPALNLKRRLTASPDALPEIPASPAQFCDPAAMSRNSGPAQPFSHMMDNGVIRRLAVVPAYNEAASVAAVVESLRLHAPDFDVLVIDDGSTDETAGRAQAAGASVVRMPFNLGIGGAVQTGFVYAKEHGYQYMAQVDGDGQHDAFELHKLLETIATRPELDVVCGSRFIGDQHEYRPPVARRIGIRLFAFALTRMSGQRVTDPSSGFRLYNRRAIELFARDYPHDYPEVEAVLMVHAHRLRMAEVPVRMHERAGGRSSIDRRRSMYYMIKVSLALLAGIMRRRVVVEPGGPASVSTSH